MSTEDLLVIAVINAVIIVVGIAIMITVGYLTKKHTRRK